MAYWGEAMTYTHPVWFQQDLNAARAVLQRLAPTPAERAAKAKSDRERAYLQAVEVLYGDGTKDERDFKYADAMAALHQKYPDDVDATAFYAVALLGTSHNGRDTATYMRAAALLEDVFPTHQHHPGVLHYLIHSYDDPVHAPLGMRAARRLWRGRAGRRPRAAHDLAHLHRPGDVGRRHRRERPRARCRQQAPRSDGEIDSALRPLRDLAALRAAAEASQRRGEEDARRLSRRCVRRGVQGRRRL